MVIFEDRHVETVENMKDISNFEIFKSKWRANYSYGMKRRVKQTSKEIQNIPYLKFPYPFNKYNLIPFQPYTLIPNNAIENIQTIVHCRFLSSFASSFCHIVWLFYFAFIWRLHLFYIFIVCISLLSSKSSSLQETSRIR